MGIGHDTKTMSTATTNQPWPGGSVDDFILGLRAFGLYRFESTFTDPATGATITNNVQRVLGAPVAGNFSGVFGGVVGHRTGVVTLRHDGIADVTTLQVTNGAFAGMTSWTGIANARTGGRDSVPGKVTITFVDSDTGATFQTQRNIGYGSENGGQMFLLDPTSVAIDTTAPTAVVTQPGEALTVYGNVALQANASDDRGVAGVQYTVDGQPVGPPLTSGPYQMTWASSTVPDGSHAIAVVATDTTGNRATSNPVHVTVANNAPSITVSSPADKAAVTGQVSVTAAVTSNSGVTRVDFYRDAGVLIGSSTSSSPSAKWDTSALVQGSTHPVYAVVVAPNGTTATSPTITVTIRDTIAPAVSLSSPTTGSVLSTTTIITAIATDNVAVARVEFFVDAQLTATDTTAPYSATWNPASVALGSHVLTARAYDNGGNVTTSAAATVTVTDTTKPTVALTKPGTNTTVARSSTITLAATAADDRVVARVEFLVNGVLKCSVTVAPYTCRWTVPNARSIRYAIKARAVDAAGNTAETSVSVTSN